MRRHWTLPLALAATLCACDSSDPDQGAIDTSAANHETARSLKPRLDAETGADAIPGLVAGQNALNADLFARLPATLDGQNAMISTLSAHLALGMTWAGATGETRDQMAGALRFDESTHAAHNALTQALLSRALPAYENDWGEKRDAVELSIVHGVWGRKNLTWKAPFLDILAENYGTGVETLDFGCASEASRQFINDWVAAATRDRVRDLLPEGSITGDTALVLTNALYFKAPWQTPFERDLTIQDDFTLLDGATVQADFVREKAHLAYAEGENWQAVEKPFRGGELRMLFVLPAQGAFESFTATFDSAALADIVTRLNAASPEVDLALPKFEFETSLSLKAPLIDLGMPLPFNPDLSDFSGMTFDTTALTIDDIFHKTFIALDESGVEAAAATAVLMTENAAPMPEDDPKIFHANRPFLFAIRDAQTNAVLFYGRVLNPK